MIDRAMLLLEGKIPHADWERVGGGRNLVRVPTLAMLTAALDTGIQELGIEVTHIILDDVASPMQFLGVLGELTHHFRGDVLWIGADGSGFLSGMTPGDGRVLYRVAAEDVDFYLTASFLDHPAGALRIPESQVCH